MSEAWEEQHGVTIHLQPGAKPRPAIHHQYITAAAQAIDSSSVLVKKNNNNLPQRRGNDLKKPGGSKLNQT